MSRSIKDLRAKTDGELHTRLAGLREEYFFRRFTSDPKRVQNPGKFQQMKREIARILTVLRERQTEDAPKAESTATSE